MPILSRAGARHHQIDPGAEEKLHLGVERGASATIEYYCSGRNSDNICRHTGNTKIWKPSYNLETLTNYLKCHPYYANLIASLIDILEEDPYAPFKYLKHLNTVQS